jgi:hypothetical protein
VEGELAVAGHRQQVQDAAAEAGFAEAVHAASFGVLTVTRYSTQLIQTPE